METGPPSETEIASTHKDFERILTSRGRPAVDSTLNYLEEHRHLKLPPETKYGYLHLIYADNINNNVLVVNHPKTGQPEYVIKIFKTDLPYPSRYHKESRSLKLLAQSKLSSHLPETIHTNNEHQYTIQRYVHGHRITTPTAEQIKLLADFTAKLHSISPTPENKQVLPFTATDAVPTPYHVYINYLKRMQDFYNYFNSDPKFHSTFLSQFEKWDIRQRLIQAETTVVNGIGQSRLHRNTPPTEMRLNQNDTSFSNTKDTGTTESPSICIFDFEYAGWDNPSDMTANFVHHVQSQNISPELKQLFVNEYVAKTQLNSEQLTDLNARLALTYLEWISIILRSTIPKRLRKFPKHQYMSRDQQRIDHFLTPVHQKLKTDPFLFQAK